MYCMKLCLGDFKIDIYIYIYIVMYFEIELNKFSQKHASSDFIVHSKHLG